MNTWNTSVTHLSMNRCECFVFYWFTVFNRIDYTVQIHVETATWYSLFQCHQKYDYISEIWSAWWRRLMVFYEWILEFIHINWLNAKNTNCLIPNCLWCKALKFIYWAQNHNVYSIPRVSFTHSLIQLFMCGYFYLTTYPAVMLEIHTGLYLV